MTETEKMNLFLELSLNELKHDLNIDMFKGKIINKFTEMEDKDKKNQFYSIIENYSFNNNKLKGELLNEILEIQIHPLNKNNKLKLKRN